MGKQWKHSILRGSKITAGGDCSHEIKRRLLFGRKAKLKSRDFTLPTNVRLGFSSGHVWMWELDYRESWALKNWCFRTVVLEKTPWESLGLQGDPTSPSKRKSVLHIHWKDWCWSWNSSTLATWCEELTPWEIPWCWERLRWEEKGMTEDEMAGWHHWLDGHEFEKVLGVGDGQRSLVGAIHGVAKSQTRLSDWTEVITSKGWPYYHCGTNQQ